MGRAWFALAGAVLVIQSACSTGSSDDKTTKKSHKTAATEDENTQNSVASAKTSESAGGLGLASGCTQNIQDERLCFSCTPREIPVTLCHNGKAPAQFAAAQQCQHTASQMTCNVDGQTFLFDFTKKSEIENIFDNLPLLLAGAKLIIGPRLEQFPNERQALYAALDAIEDHSKTLFTTGRSQPVVDAIAQIILKAKPDLPLDSLAKTKEHIIGAIDTFIAAQRSGRFSTLDVLTLVQSILSKLPPELTAVLGDKMPKLTDLTQALENEGDLDALLGIISGFDPAASTSSQTGTSTATN